MSSSLPSSGSTAATIADSTGRSATRHRPSTQPSGITSTPAPTILSVRDITALHRARNGSYLRQCFHLLGMNGSPVCCGPEFDVFAQSVVVADAVSMKVGMLAASVSAESMSWGYWVGL